MTAGGPAGAVETRAPNWVEAALTALTYSQYAETMHGLTNRIDYLRETVNKRVGWSVRPPGASTAEEHIEAAHDAARRLRHAEHALHAIGCHLDDYLPAVYRQVRP